MPSNGKILRSFAFYLGAFVVLVPFLWVFVWMGMASLKTNIDINAYPPKFVFTPTLDHYRAVLGNTPFVRYFWNSAIIATGSTLLALVLGLPAAYSIARYRQRRAAMIILAARIMPGIGYMVPWFIFFMHLGWVGKHHAIILSHLVITLPMTVWIMVSFFEDLPRELEESAQIDGCSKLGSFLRVTLPLTRPGVAAAAILSFLYSWNDFKFALILSRSETRTLPITVFRYMEYASVNWGAVMATATLITIPVIILTLAVQRHIIRGLQFGGIK